MFTLETTDYALHENIDIRKHKVMLCNENACSPSVCGVVFALTDKMSISSIEMYVYALIQFILLFSKF